jgi:hypothetical protein
MDLVVPPRARRVLALSIEARVVCRNPSMVSIEPRGGSGQVAV